MNEKNEMLDRKLAQLQKVLVTHPGLTHVYMRREDEVLVDITVDQAKPTLIRHPEWTIENEQASTRNVSDLPKAYPIIPKGAGLGVALMSKALDNPFQQTSEAKEHNPTAPEDVEVPPKPSEEVLPADDYHVEEGPRLFSDPKKKKLAKSKKK